jgi:hypothetical protein
MGCTRRWMLKAAGGAIAVSQLPIQEKARAEAVQSTERYQITYIKRHAALRAAVYDRFANRYVLSDEELKKEFRDSYTKNLKEFIFGFIDTYLFGSVMDAIKTAEWVLQTRDQAYLSLVLDAGSDPLGGSSAEQARNENRTLAARARYGQNETVSVWSAAEAYENTQTEEQKQELIDAIDAELERLRDVDAIPAWSGIRPNDYQNVVSNTRAEDIATQVKNMATANAKTLQTFKERLERQKRLLTDDVTEKPFALDTIELYESNIGRFSSDLPGWARSQFFNESINLHLVSTAGSTQSEDVVTNYYIQTDSDGTVETFDLVATDDANLEVFTTESVVQRIGASEDPTAEAKQAVRSGEIEYYGTGLNRVKYGAVKLISSPGNFVDDTVDGVTDFFGNLV